jgi:alkaline phosphatase D
MTAGFALGQALSHGPVVGGVTASTAKVFVRTGTGQSASVKLRYGIDPILATFSESATFQTTLQRDFTKIIPLAGLEPEKTYYMSVVVNTIPQPSPYPSFKTFAPSGTSREFDFVVLTDFVPTMNLTQDVPTFASAAATSPAPAFAFIGGDFDHRNPQTLAAKRQMYKDLYNAATPHMGDFVDLILRKTPIMHQWDDHDSGLNNLDKNYPYWNLNQRVFQEYVPSYPLPSVTPGIWQKFSYAQAEFFVLDCRSQRDPVTDPEETRSMLDGRDLGLSGQLQWLETGLRASTAKWKIIFTSVITNTTTKQNDAWGAYQTEWNSLKDFINTNNIQGVVFISGDLHLGAIDNGAHNGNPGFPEMCVAEPNSIQMPPHCATAPNGTWSEGSYTGTCTGFGLVTILENPDRLILQVADENGVIKIPYTVFHP